MLLVMVVTLSSCQFLIMDLSIATVSTTVSVRFAETDLMGITHHSAYIVWFEMGRVAWMDAAGVPYTEISQAGNHFAVTAINVSYRASSTFGDTLRLDTKLTKLRSRQATFNYELYHADSGILLITGSSEHICVDLNGAVSKIPLHFLTRLRNGAAELQVKGREGKRGE